MYPNCTVCTKWAKCIGTDLKCGFWNVGIEQRIIYIAIYEVILTRAKINITFVNTILLPKEKGELDGALLREEKKY